MDIFRIRKGKKAQEAPDKRQAASLVAQNSDDYNDDEEHNSGFSRDPRMRNSRFYRSMRKKRHFLHEQPAGKKTRSYMFALNCDLLSGLLIKTSVRLYTEVTSISLLMPVLYSERKTKGA